ncbi:MAG: 30S ribosomal protein S20 [Candidatus Zambryskibacteria bacterium]|nr:30S ribosomal protein S20 [Candidatus Zambryskibacteria bacterium]
MAITRGAKKAHRSSLRKREFNLRRKNKVASTLKSFKKAPTQESFRQVQKALDKAVKAKTLKRNTAARKKSRLSKLIKKL